MESSFTALLNCPKVFCFKQLHYLIKTRLSFKKKNLPLRVREKLVGKIACCQA